MTPHPSHSPLFPYTTLFRSILPGPFDSYNINGAKGKGRYHCLVCEFGHDPVVMVFVREPEEGKDGPLNTLVGLDRKSTRLNSSHQIISYAVFCLKKKTTT